MIANSAVFLLALQTQQLSLAPRFQLASPLPALPGVMIDSFLDGVGLAQPAARSKGRQARILWIDATANIQRYNSDAKIEALVAKIKSVGFNTIVFDVKPISGQVVYPSKFAPKLAEWRGQTLPKEYDPLATMCREAHRNGLSLIVSLNAFSEGHQMFKVGPGYAEPNRQSVVYRPEPIVVADGEKNALAGKENTFNADSVTVLSAISRAPDDPTGYVAELDRFGHVSLRDRAQSLKACAPAAPAGGAILYGAGSAGEFIQHHLAVGTSVRFDTEASFLPFAQSGETQYPLMMNPNDPNERAYELSIVKEVVTNYSVDGVTYDDRLRYAGIDADFSEQARSQFESVVHQKLVWPDDVLKFTIGPDLARGMRPGQFYDQWMAWRAGVVRNFLSEVRGTIEAARPGVLLGMYAGSWYGEYPALGNNYAAPQANPGFWFCSPNYRRAGDASLVDFVICGCYYKTPTIFDAMAKNTGIGSCVEGAARQVNRLVRDQAWTYAGISLADFAGDPDGLANVLQAACASSEGVMVFDLSHNIDPMWPVFARAFSQPMRPPHSDPAILAEVRRRRAALDKLGVPDSPITIMAGSSGIGQ